MQMNDMILVSVDDHVCEPSDYAKGYATIGDIMKQMAHALSTTIDSERGND